MRELVLTGLSDLWPEDEAEALFLGPWCFAYHAKYRYEQYVDFSLAPSPLVSADGMLQASQYIDSLCDRISPGLAELMNRFHSVHHSDRFWQIVTINWLVHWLGLSFDRYTRIQYACNDANDRGERLRLRLIGQDIIRPRTWGEYGNLICRHAYNHQLMSDILRNGQEFDSLQCETTDISPGTTARSTLHVNRQAARVSGMSQIRSMTSHCLGRVASRLLGRMDTRCLLGIIYGLSRWDKLCIQLSLDPLVLFKPKPRRVEVTPRLGDRGTFLAMGLEFDCQNSFEKIVKRILPFHLPAAFLKHYPDTEPDCNKARLWISNEVHGDVERLYRTAHEVERGGRWIEVQHGGGSGQVYAIGVGKAVYETPGEFITWGWTDPCDENVVYHPLPSPMLSKLPRHRPRNDTLLMVGSMMPAYHYRFQSLPQPEQLLSYIRWKERFLGGVDESLHSQLQYRPYIHDYGQGQIEHIQRAVPSCRILLKGQLTTEIARSRLIVIDHLATTFLESLVMNAPTILFWDPIVNAISISARRCFDQLRDVGILFDTPESAAEKVNLVWPDVQGWWQSSDVQKARRDFCCRFALTDSDWRKRWTEYLRDECG